MADVEREIGAFNEGAEAAAGIYGDSHFYYELPDGRSVRVLAAERSEDPKTIAAILAVNEAAERHLKDTILQEECMKMAPLRCQECPGNPDGKARCQCQ